MRFIWIAPASLLAISTLMQAKAQVVTLPSTATSSAILATPYAIEHDSLQRRVARVQARTAARIVQFRFSGLALGGTRCKVISYARVRPQNAASTSSRYARVKVQTTKHKTRGADVERIYYYGLGNRLLLAEYYEQHQLVRLHLHEYPLREGNEYGTVFRTTQWIKGDYLHLTTYAQQNRGAAQQYYYTEPRLNH